MRNDDMLSYKPPCRMKAGGFFHLVSMKSVHLLTLGSSAIDLNNYICHLLIPFLHLSIA